MENFKFEHVLIGHTPANPQTIRDRVYVNAKWDGVRLSLTGEVVAPRKRYGYRAGQITDTVRHVNPRLAELWDRWHLNDMRAGCEHQERWFRESPSLRPAADNDYRGLSTPCLECGYKYGSAWNTEQVPEEVLTEIYNILKG